MPVAKKARKEKAVRKRPKATNRAFAAATPPKEFAPRTIFISHAAEESKLAEAFALTIEQLASNKIKATYAADPSAKGGPEFGKSWFQWICSKVKESDAVLVLLTRASSVCPWLYFESGFAASLNSVEIIPIGFGIESHADPRSPLHLYQGSKVSDFTSLEDFIHKLSAKWKIKLDLAKTRTTLREMLWPKVNAACDQPERKEDGKLQAELDRLASENEVLEGKVLALANIVENLSLGYQSFAKIIRNKTKE